MKLFNKIIVCLVAVVVSATPLFAANQDSQELYHRGLGSFIYTEYEPLSELPIDVHYYIPTKGDIKGMRVLFAMHGAGRKPANAAKAWRKFAERDGFVVIAPGFSEEYYKSWQYQRGGVVYKGELQPREKWTYNTIEAIFDHFKKHTGSVAEVYDMYGHSAGGQFTHRFALAMPDARLNIAVAANPGTWTFPLINGLMGDNGEVYSFPFSVKGTPMANEESIKKFFARKLYLQAGTEDVATSGKWVPTNEASLVQGQTRFERARNMYEVSKKLAKKKGWEFNWEKVEVKGVGHNSSGMIYGTFTEVDGKKKYDINNITETSAYYLIFQKNK
ncbi:MAG: hypothetical protein IKY57_01785 [Alistipes sp.]|nr:hypothetical protein [Alistipes sp.]